MTVSIVMWTENGILTQQSEGACLERIFQEMEAEHGYFEIRKIEFIRDPKNAGPVGD